VFIFIPYLFKPYSGDHLKRLASSRTPNYAVKFKDGNIYQALQCTLRTLLIYTLNYTALPQLKAEIEPVSKWNY
jgi:hypothetical protein